MAKAILIMDMPECCTDCPCSFFERDNPILNLICGAAQEDAYNVGKPDWCPLRELPEKKENDSFLKEAVKNDCFDWTDSDTAYFNGKDAGWNACLDEILKADGMRKE